MCISDAHLLALIPQCNKKLCTATDAIRATASSAATAAAEEEAEEYAEGERGEREAGRRVGNRGRPREDILGGEEEEAEK